ncbi:hypothetical protein QUF74_10395 [Candidatus Halobeggiatoa sp. HSG11]|nr:hypothetical protein [Candidatus Halobeggiatoa sp. HSG11]
MQLSIVILVLILFAVGTTAFGMYVWHKSRHYTRERFAFVALAALTSFIAIATISTFIGAAPWQVLFTFFAQGQGLEYTPKETTPLEYVFFVLLFIFFVFIVKHIYDNWPGAMSVKQYKRTQRQESGSLIVDGMVEAGRIVKRLPTPEIYNPDDTSGTDSVLEGSLDTLIWHEQALDLIMLGSKSYDFDKNEGWHDQQNCWIGRQKKTGNTVILGCWTESPTEEQLQTLVDYAHHMAKSQLEIIVAIRHEIDVETREINNIKIKFENEAHLLDNLVDFDDYRTDIKYKVEKTPLTDSELTINDIYVPSAFTIEEKSEEKHQNIENYLQTWLQDSSQRQIALLGEYGQGKSTGSLLFTYHLLTQEQPTRIPILIELRGKSPRNLTIEEILATWAKDYGIDSRSVMKLLIAGRLLLILEGFDEMALIGDAEMRQSHFRTLWQFCYPKSKIIITGRPNFFLDDIDRKAALGIQEPSLERPYCEALHLSPFGVDKIEESLRTADAKTREEIVQLAKDDAKFREIVSRPSLLYIVKTLWKDGKLSQYKGRMNSALVMGMFIKQSLARQTAKVQDNRDFMVLNSSEREYFMLGIAAYMAKNELPNQITKLQLDEAVRLLLKVIPDSASTVDTMSGEKSTPLHQRLPKDDEEKALEYVKTDVRSCGLLVSDLSKSGTFKFAHKSFMEYLFANLVHNRLVRNQLPEEEEEITGSIWNTLKTEIQSILQYKESTSFMTELLSDTISENIAGFNDNMADKFFNLILLGKAQIPWQIKIKKQGLLSILHSNKIHIKNRRIMLRIIILLNIILFALIFAEFYLFSFEEYRYIRLKDFLEQIEPQLFYEKIHITLVSITILLMYIVQYIRGLNRIFFKTSLGQKLLNKFTLWYQCCKALKIEDEEIEEVVGKWAMPAFKSEQD